MKKVILGRVAITALVACSKYNGNDNSNSNGGLNNNGDPTIEQETFPKEITYKDKNGNIIMKSVYTIVGGKIAGLTWTSYEDKQVKSEKTIINYNGDLPEKELSSGQTETYTYEGNKLIKKIEEREREGSIRKTETTYTYEGGKLSKIIEMNKTGHDELADKTKLNQKESTVTYTVEKGNLVKEEVTISPSHKVVTEYTYDSKKNPKSINLQKILLPDYFTNINISKNNILTITQTITENGQTEVKRSSYEYVYNGDYPTIVREFQEKNGNRVLEETTEYKY